MVRELGFGVEADTRWWLGVLLVGRGVVPVTPGGTGPEVMVEGGRAVLPGAEVVGAEVEEEEGCCCCCCCWEVRSLVMMEASSVRVSTASGERPSGMWTAIVGIFLGKGMDGYCNQAGAQCLRQSPYASNRGDGFNVWFELIGLASWGTP